jgi:hypothetical protein
LAQGGVLLLECIDARLLGGGPLLERLSGSEGDACGVDRGDAPVGISKMENCREVLRGRSQSGEAFGAVLRPAVTDRPRGNLAVVRRLRAAVLSG